ncbi:MAG: indolepyruvate oxidoreductase subunit beta [Christensenellales bacterium]|jgi:indolepyruvate ferredoxin oxidoreductase beta subunit
MIQIVIVGVGGQGTLLASKILGHIAVHSGLDTKVSEVHGMSQRGGSVITHVRIAEQGEKVHAPLVEQGGADVVLAFERLEALRALPYLKKGGTMILNDQKILPMPVITGAAEYPEDALSTIRASANTIAVDALSVAMECGSVRAANVVMLGVLSRLLPFAPEVYEDAIRALIRPQFVELNLAAFAAGRALTD